VASREDLDRIVWPDEGDLEARLRHIREYVKAPEVPASA